MNDPPVKRKKIFFHVMGSCIVASWIILVGVLIKRTYFPETQKETGILIEEPNKILDKQRDWMEIYLSGKKVGYAVRDIHPVEDVYLSHEEIFIRLNIMGQDNNIHTINRSVLDHQFKLRSFMFQMVSGVVSFKISGKVDGNRLLLETGEGPMKRKKTIRLSGPPVLGSGIVQFFKGRILKVGESYRFPLFDPSSTAQKEVIIEVVKRETIVINRIEYLAFRLQTKMLGQQMDFWVDENGTVLKEESLMGLTLVKSSAANAPRNISSGAGDNFYDLAAIAVKKKIQRPRQLSYLKIRIKDINEIPFNTSTLNKGRQSLAGDILEVTREQVPSNVEYKEGTLNQQENMDSFLKPEFNIESDDKAIIKRAREIRGSASNPATIARRHMTWVYNNVKKRPVISVPSASQVLKSRIGDCNEHAVLLAALLRASKIPARLCAGLVYTRDKFFYHAWIEGYLGKWISMDATLNQMPADASHIKLVEGGLEKQVDIIGLMGKLKMEVVDYRYD